MSLLKKTASAFLCAFLALSAAMSLSSCNNASFTADEKAIATDPGKISSTPYNAVYNDDGTFTLTIAIYNGTKYTKILNEIDVKTLTDDKDRVIVEDGSFTLDETKYLKPSATDYVECVFEADEVKNKLSLKTLKSSISLHYYGCVQNGEAPAVGSNNYTMSLITGEITETGGFDGTISIRNNFSVAKTPKTISFDVYDDNGVKLNKTKITKTNDQTIKAGETLSVSLGLTAGNIDETLAADRSFNTLTIKNISVSE